MKMGELRTLFVYVIQRCTWPQLYDDLHASLAYRYKALKMLTVSHLAWDLFGLPPADRITQLLPRELLRRMNFSLRVRVDSCCNF